MGITYRDVPLDTISADLPMVNRDGLARVVETRGAGMLRAAAIMADLAAFLPGRGVTLRPETAVRDLDPVTGRLGGETFDEIVVAAGAWLPALIPG